MRKGQFIGTPLVFFGLLLLAIVIAIVLFVFFSGFLQEGGNWVTENIGQMFSSIGTAISSFVGGSFSV